VPWLVAFEAYLVLPIFSIVSVGFNRPRPVSPCRLSGFASSRHLDKRRPLGLSTPGHDGLAVLVKKMEGLLAVLGIAVVSGGVIILAIPF
jgi:hypothetical protein